MNDIYTRKRDAYKSAYDETKYDLTDLIRPDDVKDGADSWDDISDETLDEECHESVSVMMSEGQLAGIEDELAFGIWLNSLTRAPLEDLVFDTDKEAIENGYWPNHTNKWDAEEMLRERGIEQCPIGIRDESREVVSAGAFDKLHPRREKDASRL